MRKIILGLVVLVLVTGCAQKSVTEYQLIEDHDNIRVTTKDTITSQDDFVVSVASMSKFEFLDDEAKSGMEGFARNLTDEKACPSGIWSSEEGKMVACSEYIVVDFEVDGNAIILTTTYDYDRAFRNKESIVSQEAGGIFKDDTYFSLELFEKEYRDQGYEKIK